MWGKNDIDTGRRGRGQEREQEQKERRDLIAVPGIQPRRVRRMLRKKCPVQPLLMSTARGGRTIARRNKRKSPNTCPAWAIVVLLIAGGARRRCWLLQELFVYSRLWMSDKKKMDEEGRQNNEECRVFSLSCRSREIPASHFENREKIVLAVSAAKSR